MGSAHAVWLSRLEHTWISYASTDGMMFGLSVSASQPQSQAGKETVEKRIFSACA